MNKYKWIILILGGLLVLGLVIISITIKSKDWDGNNDYKLGIITDNEIELVSISFSRRMINILKVNGEVEMWIPEGLGWYRVDRVKKILDQENKASLANNLFFYNFGFTPDKILFLNSIDDWKKNSVFLQIVGVKNWIKFQFNREDMMTKEEIIKKSLVDDYPLLSEIMMRDFSDNRVLNEDLKVGIINTTNESGMATFLADRMEWAGFSIISTENSEKEVKNCLVEYGSEVENSFSYKILGNLWNCEMKKNESLDNSEVEIYFGDGFAQMVKYSSYVRTL